MSSPDPSQTPQPGQDDSSKEQSAGSSAPTSRGGSKPPKEKHRVRFTPGGESLDVANNRAAFDVRDDSDIPTQSRNVRSKPRPLPPVRPIRSHSDYVPRTASGSEATDGSESSNQPQLPTLRLSYSDPEGDLEAEVSRGRGKHREGNEGDGSQDHEDEETEENESDADEKVIAQEEAQQRGERLSRMEGTHSAPGSRFASPPRTPPAFSPSTAGDTRLNFDGIPLEKWESRREKYGIEDTSDDEDENRREGQKKSRSRFHAAARRLVQHHTKRDKKNFAVRVEPTLQSGQVTPNHEQDVHDYVARPSAYREGILSSLLRLYNDPERSISQSLLGSRTNTPGQTPGGSPDASGATTPRSGEGSSRTKRPKWYHDNQHSHSTGSISDLVSASTMLAQPVATKSTNTPTIRPKPKHRPRSFQAMDAIFGKKKKGPKSDDSYRIEVHIAETIQRQGFLMKMCRALMQYGAPTHRLEEYMRMSARVLEIDGQFLYIPGCMIISFDDASMHTTEVKLVRSAQDVNLGKLRDTHEVYKEVVHDKIGVEEAIRRLNEITSSKAYFSPWTLVFVYGFASAFVGPFAFGARPTDLPIAFFLGCLVGIMRLILATNSQLYDNVFEITASVLTSFLARAFGSIRGGNIFCFSALAQSSIALILPGYTVLCGSLELQSRSVVAGSVRMVYAIIYSLFLGFGITVGTSIYGGIDKHATSATTCQTTMPTWYSFIFVPLFTLCLIIINQGKLKQMPVMLGIAFVGYIVNHFSALWLQSNAQIANTLGAFAIGAIGNLYSRFYHGLAAAAMLPAIFVQVPSGLAASGSLISGVTSANQITNHTNGTTVSDDGTGTSGMDVNHAVLNVGYSMIQVAIGITVGLFLSALVIYPFGKRRSGLFSF